jgi:hypothetical protein
MKTWPLLEVSLPAGDGHSLASQLRQLAPQWTRHRRNTNRSMPET